MYNIKLLNKISKEGLDGFDENYAYSEETLLKNLYYVDYFSLQEKLLKVFVGLMV